MFFYNTINLKGVDLTTALTKAATQEDRIFEFFKNNENKEFTPAEIHAILFKESTPLTSIRRGISNLTRIGALKQTENRRKGEYGMLNYCWKLNS